MLTFVMLKKVYKNENSNLVFGNIFSAENDCRKAVWGVTVSVGLNLLTN